MKTSLFYSLLVVTGLLMVLAGCKPGQGDKTGESGIIYNLVWQDEFEYTGLPDSAKWSYDTAGNKSAWGNNELQFYTFGRKENAWVENGVLTITALKEKYEYREYTSARLVTKDKGDWLYGKIEVKAKLPSGLGSWPAVWMLPTDWEYGGWPDSGEIDIMEHVGFNPDTLFGTVHTKAFNGMIGTQRGVGIKIDNPYSEFHLYALEWSQDSIHMFLDGKKYFAFANERTGFAEWPFDKRFHLLLNIAVGGNWGGAKGMDDQTLPYKMEVDFVRVYQH